MKTKIIIGIMIGIIISGIAVVFLTTDQNETLPDVDETVSSSESTGKVISVNITERLATGGN